MDQDFYDKLSEVFRRRKKREIEESQFCTVKFRRIRISNVNPEIVLIKNEVLMVIPDSTLSRVDFFKEKRINNNPAYQNMNYNEYLSRIKGKIKLGDGVTMWKDLPFIAELPVAIKFAKNFYHNRIDNKES